MKRLGVQDVAVAAIEVPERLRPVDRDWIEAVAASIRENGLEQPIQVYIPQGRDLRPPERIEGPFRLIAGAHRLAAVDLLLGQSKITATVFWGNEDEARLQEIDENLIRRELSPLHRAKFLAERKALYEKLHPETKRGAKGGRRRGSDLTDNESVRSTVLSFSAQTAERIGLSERHIRRQIALWNALHPEAREVLAGLPVANNSAELKLLATLDPALQRLIADQLASGQHKRVRDAVAKARPRAQQQPSPDAKLLDAWQRSGRKGRVAFLRHLVELGVVAGFDQEAC